MDEAWRILTADFTATIGYIPRLVGALVIIIIGAAVAWLAGRLTRVLLAGIGFDALGERTGLTDDLGKLGVQMRPAALIGRLVFFIALLAAINQAIDTLEFAPLSQALRELLNFTPHVLLAALLVLLGVIVADTLARGAAGAMSRAGVLYHGVAGSVLRSVVIVLAVFMALQQLTIDSGFFLYVLLVILGSAALAAGIAGGWGARSLAENLIAGRYVEREFQVGDFVRVDGTAGTIERLSATSVIVRTNDKRRITVPNALLTKMAVESASAIEPSPQPQ